MTTTRYYTATSLDGFIADQDNSLTWLFEVENGGETDADFARFFAGIGAMCMGATTYEWILANDSAESWQSTYGDLPTWVFTHRDLPAVAGANLRFVSGGVEPVHREMTEAAGEKDIWIIGGGGLAGEFADAGLLDEIIATVAPVTLGAGAPLLPRRVLAERMTLTKVEQIGRFAQLTYRLGR
ncbi:dihydrofolate reductase family protein [Nocardia sp. NPDC005366]|uniref:dihydrofolate reductase family protein n=1 Tax=Nocardia sp. NPDC005366 TaxID=3156878 RepID=UPI0033AD3BD1